MFVARSILERKSRKLVFVVMNLAARRPHRSTCSGVGEEIETPLLVDVASHHRVNR